MTRQLNTLKTQMLHNRKSLAIYNLSIIYDNGATSC